MVAHMRKNENETVCGRIKNTDERNYNYKMLYMVDNPEHVTCKRCLAKMEQTKSVGKL